MNIIPNKLAYICPGGDLARVVLQRTRRAKVGNNVFIAQQVYFDELHPEAIEIGDDAPR